MQELDRAIAALEQHRKTLREVEIAYAERLDELERLRPRGLLGRLLRRGDPSQIASSESALVSLGAELSRHRAEVQRALEAVERLEIEQRRAAMIPSGAQDPSSAAVALRTLERLGFLIAQLQVIAGTMRLSGPAKRGTKRQQQSVSRDLGMREGKVSALNKWEQLLDEAELLADALGFMLVLPRLGIPRPRPDDGPFPPIDVLVGRESARVGSEAEFVRVADSTADRLRQLEANVSFAMAAIEERFPDATILRDQLPADVPPTGLLGFRALHQGKGDGGERLIQAWEALSKTVALILRGADSGGRTADQLGPLLLYKTQAKLVRSYPLARAQGLLPPVSQGEDLAVFVQRLQQQWPALHATYQAWRSQSGTEPPEV